MINDLLLLRQLNESGRYRHVYMLRSNARGDYVLRISIRFSRGLWKCANGARSVRFRAARQKDWLDRLEPLVFA